MCGEYTSHSLCFSQTPRLWSDRKIFVAVDSSDRFVRNYDRFVLGILKYSKMRKQSSKVTNL